MKQKKRLKLYILIHNFSVMVHVHYFLSNLYFSPNDSPSNTVKNVFLFHLKRSFHSGDIQIFVFSRSPLFRPVSHCFRCWFKNNVKVYDVLNCLSKNLITHVPLYHDKEIRWDSETLSIDRVLNAEHFDRKIKLKLCIKN